jgi:predicted alpha/beta hydrolase family esterase
MADIAGIPFVEANFDKDGNLQNVVDLPFATTDVFIMSHGWNNNKSDAQKLYDGSFGNFADLQKKFDFTGRQLGIVGVFWPSKKFDDLTFQVGQSNAAAVGVGDDGQALVGAKLEGLKSLFSAPTDIRKIDAAKAALAGIETSPTERKKFVSKIRSLLNSAAANREDASDTFFESNEEELMENLRIPIAATVPPEAAGGVALDIRSGPPVEEGGGAAIGGFLDLESFKTAALNILNYASYYEMKTRAGTVGSEGVAPLVDKLATEVDRIHLIGHSFGGRLVAAAAKEAMTSKLVSLVLLQAAFSHNGFSKNMGGFFRAIVETKRVAGPILITYSKNDTAVGLAYPIASRINNDVTMAIGDENDKFGGIGRNGAQKMESGEVDTIETVLRDADGKYAFSVGKVFNLFGDTFIKNHGDVTGKQIVNAVLNAVAKPKEFQAV